MRSHDYKNKIHNQIQTEHDRGEELHIVTSNAFGSRVLKIRMNRVVPSKTGYTGYTKVGFFLSKKEAAELRDSLSELLDDDEAWAVVSDEELQSGGK